VSHSILKGTALGLLLAAGLSCDPRSFDDLENTTWVQFAERNDSQVSGSFGMTVTAVPLATGQKGARFIVASANPTGLSQVTFDEHGGLSEQLGSAINTTLAPFSTSAGLIYSLAPYVTSTKVQFVAGQTASGNGTGVAAIMDLGLKTPGTALTYPASDNAANATLYGYGLAVGDLGSAGTAQDVVVVAENAITLFPGNGTAAKACYIKRPNVSSGYGGGLHNAVIANINGTKRLLVSGNAIRPPIGNNVPEILFLEASDIVDNTACPVDKAIVLPGGDGTPTASTIVVGDFDGNNTNDVAFAITYNSSSNTPGTLGVFMNLTDLTGATPVTIPTVQAVDVATTAFGSVALAADVDGVKGDELIVADPIASVNNVSQAGHVFVYKSGTTCPALADGTTATRGTFCILTMLFDPSPSTKDLYGQAMAVTPFDAAATSPRPNVLAISENNKLWVYFRAIASAKDPRL